jgi:stage III sporulation protein AE
MNWPTGNDAAANYQQEFNGVLGSQLSNYDLTGLSQPGLPSFGELSRQIITGEFDFSLSGILHLFSRLIFNELFANTRLIKQLLIIAVLSALLKCLTDAFKHKSAGELGFYVTYCIMVILVITSFQVSVEILSGLVAAVSGMMDAAIPLIIGLLAVSVNVAGAAVFHPALFLAMGLITRFIGQILIPLMLAAVAMQAVSCLIEGNPLHNLSLFFKKCADWTLKGIIGLFAMLLALQKLSAPIINNIALQTTKSAVKSIPLVGNALNAAMDTVLVWGQATRSTVLVALVIVFCVALAAPLVKMLVLMLVYRLMAAVIQPFSDDRFVKLLDMVGAYLGTIMSAGVMVGIMCVYAVIMLLTF